MLREVGCQLCRDLRALGAMPKPELSARIELLFRGTTIEQSRRFFEFSPNQHVSGSDEFRRPLQRLLRLGIWQCQRVLSRGDFYGVLEGIKAEVHLSGGRGTCNRF